MNKLKINFQLQELDKIVPWGQEPHLSLHWFGLTDGLLWLNVGTQTIYEYTEEAMNYFGNNMRYNDYQISRFLEDFFETFRYVGESIPEELYHSLDEFDAKIEKWKECHIEEEDEVFDKFYFDEYCELGEWRWDRTLDSGHLVGGPHIGFFRCGEKIKILWGSNFKLDNGNSIWTSPEGSFEMPYDEFVLSVKDFFDLFFIAMDKQVENAVMKEWGSISLDKQKLLKEHEERKSDFSKKIGFLENTNENTDWNKVMMLYKKMEDEIKMQNDNSYVYTKIRDNIWQIAEDNGVYCTLIKGSKMAVLIDTGYGYRNLRAFIEENITTPYMVINSHGHPDHIGGNHWFDTVYAAKEEWDIIKHFEKEQRNYELKEMQTGSRISLGNIHIDIVLLAGHTKGSIGFIVQEEKLLIAGDAFNEDLWLFNYGSLSMQQLYDTLNRTIHLDFDSYLCGHSDKEYKKEKLLTHIRNIENLKVDESTEQNLLGFETYCSSYEDMNGRSEIIFTKDRLEM